MVGRSDDWFSRVRVPDYSFQTTEFKNEEGCTVDERRYEIKLRKASQAASDYQSSGG